MASNMAIFDTFDSFTDTYYKTTKKGNWCQKETQLSFETKYFFVYFNFCSFENAFRKNTKSLHRLSVRKYFHRNHCDVITFPVYTAASLSGEFWKIWFVMQIRLASWCESTWKFNKIGKGRNITKVKMKKHISEKCLLSLLWAFVSSVGRVATLSV